MSDSENIDTRVRRKWRDESPDRSLDRSARYNEDKGERKYRRRTDGYERKRSPDVEGHRSPRKRSRSPAQRYRDGSEQDARERPSKRRRSLDEHEARRREPRYGVEERDKRRHQHRHRSRDREADDNRVKRRESSPSTHHRHSRRDRSRPRSPRRHRHRRRSHSASSSPQPKSRRSKAPLPSQQDAFTSTSGRPNDDAVGPPVEKQKPNYQASGKLAAETNTVAGTDIVLKYNEPPEARKPSSAHLWRMYEFKGDNPDPLSTTELFARSCWLFGRERAVVDFLIEHPSCSKQHAVVQFRYVEKRSEFGDRIGGVKPFVIDLESANGTKVNGERIPDRRYWEIKNGDVLGFGDSTREYVIMLPPKE